MCGRYTLIDDEGRITARFDVARWLPGFDLTPNDNVAPTHTTPVIRAVEGGREVAPMRWGLIPPWAKDAAIGSKTINARAEGVEDKPSYRTPFRRRRCLVPASGFYEWRKVRTGKQPISFRLKDDELFAFAGLYDRWTDPEGEAVGSSTIVTTTPNPLVEPVHNRMPVMLRRDDEEPWLDPEIDDVHLLHSLLTPYPAEAMTATPVSPAVNNVRANDASLIAPV